MSARTSRIVLTPGEPGGIGPDLAVQLAAHAFPFDLLVLASTDLLRERASSLKLDINIIERRIDSAPECAAAGELAVCDIPCAAAVQPGQAQAVHAEYVLQTLDAAVQACQAGHAAAMVTGPVHKASIIEAGKEFSGHTEYLAQKTGSNRVLMLLASEAMRVALLTTHIPLADVSVALQNSDIEGDLRLLIEELSRKFKLESPKIAVCGLNPHAGESGHIGFEDEQFIAPACEQLRAEGYSVAGPVAADTIFAAHNLRQYDAIVTMYHDQGLPVIKHAGFGRTVNVTLGLPLIRTSVDHGTALDLAGTGKADSGSLLAALDMAHRMCS